MLNHNRPTHGVRKPPLALLALHAWLAATCALPGLMPNALATSLQAGAIQVDSDGAVIDGNTNLLVLPKVRITQGGYVISAEEARATGLNVDNSRWSFNGNVQVTTPDGQCNAEQAIVTFRNNQISNVQITGKPATFAQRSATRQLLAEGRAEQITYDFTQNTVRMDSQAWIRYGQNEFSGTSITYDIVARRVLAAPEAQKGERVRITIQPSSTGPTTNATTNKGSAP